MIIHGRVNFEQLVGLELFIRQDGPDEARSASGHGPHSDVRRIESLPEHYEGTKFGARQCDSMRERTTKPKFPGATRYLWTSGHEAHA